MFESLSQRLQSVFSRLGRKSTLTESDVALVAGKDETLSALIRDIEGRRGRRG